MKAIRGAITVNEDNPEQIKQAVKELLGEISAKNSIGASDIICIMFSSTDDLKSYYPAKAARECGYSSCALYSSIEPDIADSLKKCIRVMLLVDSDKSPNHVYLREAKSLRKDISKIINIALDGPAGSGKSTVSKIVANRLGILYLDTGAMYRAIALKCVQNNADYCDQDVVKNIVNKLDLTIDYRDGKQITLLDGVDVGDKIRTPQVSLLASYVSAYSFVRTKMVQLQRNIAAKFSCILDGRDIGTNVLPECEFKFFLTASPEIRAQRRYDENLIKGGGQTFEEVLRDINERDFQDKNRAIAPLKQAKDAIVIDTSAMSAEQVAETILNKIQEKI